MDTDVKPEASRIIVYERVVRGIFNNTSVQNRVSIDRFTGGTRDGALFNDPSANRAREFFATRPRALTDKLTAAAVPAQPARTRTRTAATTEKP